MLGNNSRRDSLEVSVATDYDASRKNDDDTESLEAIKERIPARPSVSEDESDQTDSFTIPDVVNEELEVVVLPLQDNEFTCMSCFLVKPHGQRSKKKDICIECAA